MTISWPEAILHLDGDAFFASVTQAVHPEYKGKPLVTGKERGIATAVSHEARKFGITRAMQISEMRKLCPHLIVAISDYRLYHLFSKKMFTIMRKYSPSVEEYSIDEGFADLKGLRRPLHSTYEGIAQSIKQEIESSLGITVSLGVSVTKSLAKLAANLNKPSGLTVVGGKDIDSLLQKVDVSNVWGIGHQTTSYLRKLNIVTAYDFAHKDEWFIRERFSKPFYEIWRELNGHMVYAVNAEAKREYKSIMRSQTVTPPTTNPTLLWARLLEHIEQSFLKARNYNYAVGKVSIFLKTQNFHHHATEIKLSEATSYPLPLHDELKKAFLKIYRKDTLYRATGATISDLRERQTRQASLFGNEELFQKAKKLYPLYDSKKIDFGTSLFDKKRIIERKKDVKITLPFLSRIE